MRLTASLVPSLLTALLIGSGLSYMLPVSAAAEEKLAAQQDSPDDKAEKKSEKGTKKAKAAKEADEEKTGDGKDILKQWTNLHARREKIAKSFEKLAKDFATADPDTKKQLEATAVKMQTEFLKDIQPTMLKLAPQVYAIEPTNIEAGEIVMTLDFQENKFDKVVAIADKLMAANKDKTKTPLILNLGGVANFAVNNFEKAHELLALAKKTDDQLFPRLGARFLDASSDYIDLWKKEQKIRAKEAEADDLPRVLLKTNRGDILLELFENEAPNTVANFISLVEAKKYDGTLFHRVEPLFMAQGGDPNSLDDDPNNDGTGGPGYRIACECYREDARKHFQGSLSMAHAGKDTGGSQFFITQLPTPHLNPDAEAQRGHTVFGRVIEGMDVSESLVKGDKIESATVVRKRDHAYVPKKLADKDKGPATGKAKKKTDDE